MSEILVLITIEELAEILRLDARTIYRKVRENKIPGAIRPFGENSSIRFNKAVIDKWLNDQCKQGGKV